MWTSRLLIRSIFTLGIAQVVSWLGAAVLTVVLPRYLGDTNLGKLAFAMAFTFLASQIADLGAATYLTKEVARDPARAGQLISNALAIRFLLGLLAAAVAVVGINLSGADALTRQIVYILSVSILLDGVGRVLAGSLQGLHRMKVVAAASLVTKLVYAALAAAALLHGWGPRQVAAASVVSVALALALSLVALLRCVRLTPRLTRATMGAVLWGGLPFFIWQAALLVYGQIDAVLLSFLTHDAVVGWYSAAYRIVGMPVFVPTIMITVLFPALSAAAKHTETFNAMARRTLHVVLLLNVPMVFGIMLLADKWVRVLHYPASFGNSIAPLMLLAPHILLVGADMVIGTVLNSRDRQRQWALAAVAAAILNPLANLIAIPYTQHAFGNGAIGAALTTTLTELFMLVVGLRLLPAGVFGRETVSDTLKCLAAGAAMAVVVVFTRELPIAVPVLLGAIAYGGGCLAFGAISLGDLRQLRVHLLERQTTGAPMVTTASPS